MSRKQLPISLLFIVTYYLLVSGRVKTLISTWEGRLIIFGSVQEVVSEVDLLRTLDESIESNQCLEMVTADSAAIDTSPENQGDVAFFATCWVVCDTSGNSVRFLAALFRVRIDGASLGKLLLFFTKKYREFLLHVYSVFVMCIFPVSQG